MVAIIVRSSIDAILPIANFKLIGPFLHGSKPMLKVMSKLTIIDILFGNILQSEPILGALIQIIIMPPPQVSPAIKMPYNRHITINKHDAIRIFLYCQIGYAYVEGLEEN